MLIQTSPIFLFEGQIYNLPALVMIMAGRRTGDTLVPESMIA